jgi:hypothetical protein
LQRGREREHNQRQCEWSLGLPDDRAQERMAVAEGAANIMKVTRCATSAQITAMSSTATPESHGGAQNNASRTEDNIDAPSAMSCGHVVRPCRAAASRRQEPR